MQTTLYSCASNFQFYRVDDTAGVGMMGEDETDGAVASAEEQWQQDMEVAQKQSVLHCKVFTVALPDPFL